jgi:hypothetical protein
MDEPHPSLPPETDRESLSKLENEFYQQYGHTLANWARFEQSLSTLFCELCRLQRGDLGSALFFSGKSFNTRAALLGAAARNAELEEEAQEVIRALLKKGRQFETARNKIAHGYPVHAIWPNVEWQGWRIKEGDEAHQPGGIGITELKNAAECFARLEFYAERVKTFVSNWRLGVEMPPEGYLELIRALPNDALLAIEDPRAKASPLPLR